MKITREADYAVRILYALSCAGKQQTARELAETSGISLRFGLKILARLSQSGLVSSQKGAQGGYSLAKTPEEITLYDIIFAIDGEIFVNACFEDDHDCTRIGDKTLCDFRLVFAEVSESIKAQLSAVTLSKFIK